MSMLLSLAVATLAFQADVAEKKSAPFTVEVFTAGADGYFAFRIPSLITTPKGTLLAFAEGRKSSLEDLGNNDLVVKRSTDSGRTWQPMQVIHDDGTNTIGNPTAVVDGDTGVIWLLFCRNAFQAMVTSSKDDGKTWTKPVDITAQVKQMDWGMFAIGPGIGIQIQHGQEKGRLVIPAYHRLTKDRSGPSYAHMIYSDNHGKSWKFGKDVGPHTNECQLVEILDKMPGQKHGNAALLVNSRNHWARSGGRRDLAGKRVIARSVDSGQSWGKPEFDETLIEPTCQASMLRYSWPEDGKPSLILFANPASRGRNRMTVRLSSDEGKTWSHSRLIDAGPSAYSCLTALPVGEVGLIYEKGPYKSLTFTSFSLDWLKSGGKTP